MPFITVREWETITLSELDDRIYNRIETAFRKFLGDKAKSFMEAHLHTRLKDLSCNSFVDVLECVKIL